MFQSRNRDTSLFRWRFGTLRSHKFKAGFNLAIEILLFSGIQRKGELMKKCQCVSISQSRYFSFQVFPKFRIHCGSVSFNLAIEILLFSGQQPSATAPQRSRGFQSRNRDTSLFRADNFNTEVSLPSDVSISQSRYFSFQGIQGDVFHIPLSSFNLAIEILLFSGAPHRSPYRTCLNPRCFHERCLLSCFNPRIIM